MSKGMVIEEEFITGGQESFKDVYIAVLSKGRAEDLRTTKQLQAVGYDFHVFVEPQEAEAYKQANPDINNWVVLPADDKGIAYVRNHILDTARAAGAKWLIMCDDDINHFGTVFQDKAVNTDATVLAEALECIKRYPMVTLASLEYRQFAWSAKPYNFCTFCDVCVFIRLDRNTARYDDTVNLKEDRDFALQTLKAQQWTMRLGNYFFNCPAIGTNKGGLEEMYANRSAYMNALNNMFLKWGSKICKVVKKKNGVLDLKINWQEAQKV